MESITTARRLTIPARLRAIFGTWGEPCDPAPRVPGGEGVALYRALSGSAPVPLGDAALQQIEDDARLNASYGQCAELRREGELVLRWVRALRAPRPAPSDLFIPY